METPLSAASDPSQAPARPTWRRRLLLLAGLLATVLLVILGALAGGVGVGHRALAADYEGPAALDSATLARFAYPEANQSAPEFARFDEQEGWGHSSRWVQLEVTAPERDPSGEPHLVQIIHFRPSEARLAPGERTAAVVVSPTLGGSNELAKLVAASLARRGIHGAVVLRAETFFDAEHDEARLERVLRTAVIDRRRAIDWLCEQPDVDPERIGAFGASMGGVATTLLAAVEPRVKASVVALAGGDLASMLVASDQPRVARYRRELGLDPAELESRVRQALVSDPLHLAPAVDARHVLFVQGARDRTVPSAQQEELWQALGQPRRLLLPTGHYTSAAYLPFLLCETVTFLERELAGETRD